MTSPTYAPVYQLTRGRIVESVHFGAGALVDSGGRLLAFFGDPGLTTFMRSSAKPFQALPFVQAGGPAHFGLSEKELALICASHSGTDDHVATALRIQSAAGFSEADLQCGVHPPGDKATRERMLREGQTPRVNNHNCSGKHSGMLAFARMNGWPLETYLENDHPVQEKIRATLLEMTSARPDELEIGIDGCSAPNFAIPLYNAALGYARLADPSGLEPDRARACKSITAAMMTHPDMIAGPGAFDTRLMEVCAGRLFAKGGAEGYQGVGLRPGTLREGSPGIGLALKISDGAGRSGLRAAVVLEVLRQLGVLSESELAALADFGPEQDLRNFADKLVGQGRPCLALHLFDC